MSSDSERFLERLTPRGAPPPLRERVLDSVTRELAVRPAAHWSRWAWGALAASLLLGVALNVGLERAHEAKLAEIYGPKPVPREVAEMTRTIEKVTDKQTASWYQQELLAAVRRRQVPPQDLENYWKAYYGQLRQKE